MSSRMAKNEFPGVTDEINYGDRENRLLGRLMRAQSNPKVD